MVKLAVADADGAGPCPGPEFVRAIPDCWTAGGPGTGSGRDSGGRRQGWNRGLGGDGCEKLDAPGAGDSDVALLSTVEAATLGQTVDELIFGEGAGIFVGGRVLGTGLSLGQGGDLRGESITLLFKTPA